MNRHGQPSETAAEPRLVLGLQPVREVIRAHGARATRILLEARAPGNSRLDSLARFARDQGIRDVVRVPRSELDRLAGGTRHQGAAALAPPLALFDPSGLLDRADLVAVALDGIQDPQNFGAVIRSAVGVADAAIVWPEHGSAPLTPATFRASAGAIEHAELCRVPSLVAWLQQAADAGAQIVGLDPQGPRPLRSLDLTTPTVLVVGSEDRGLQRATRRACQHLTHLVATRQVGSLNAAASTAMALYEISIQRGKSAG